MGDYYNQARGTIEIILPEGHIIPPAGCIIAVTLHTDLIKIY